MSAIDDARTLVQDIVAPDLKAIAARLDALEKAVKVAFETFEKSVDQRFSASEKLAEARHELMILRMQNGFATMDAKFAAADAKFEAFLKIFDTDRRLMQLETNQAKLLGNDERHV